MLSALFTTIGAVTEVRFLLGVQEVPGSNPGSPTNPLIILGAVFELPRKPYVDDFVDAISCGVPLSHSC